MGAMDRFAEGLRAKWGLGALGIAAIMVTVALLGQKGRVDPSRPEAVPAKDSQAASQRTTMHRLQPSSPASAETPSRQTKALSSRASKKPAEDAPTTVVDAGESRHPYVSEDMLSLPDSYSPETAFGEAAKEFDVPADLLKALAFVETKGEHRHGVRQPDGGFGVMKLRESPELNTLEEAATLLKVEKKALVQDPVQNIRGAAAVLRSYYNQAARQGSATAPWLTALTLYSGKTPEQAVATARDIENILFEGMTYSTSFGEQLVVAPRQDYLLTGKEKPATTPESGK